MPRIGECIKLTYRTGDEPLKDHYFRVKDVMYVLDNQAEHQAAVLVEEDHNPTLLPE